MRQESPPPTERSHRGSSRIISPPATDDRQSSTSASRHQFADVLRAAPTGTVDPDIDPDDVFDIMRGAIVAHTIVPTIAARHAPIERTIDLLIRMVRLNS